MRVISKMRFLKCQIWKQPSRRLEPSWKLKNQHGQACNDCWQFCTKLRWNFEISTETKPKLISKLGEIHRNGFEISKRDRNGFETLETLLVERFQDFASEFWNFETKRNPSKRLVFDELTKARNFETNAPLNPLCLCLLSTVQTVKGEATKERKAIAALDWLSGWETLTQQGLRGIAYRLPDTSQPPHTNVMQCLIYFRIPGYIDTPFEFLAY